MPASRVIPPPGSTNFFPGIGSKLRIKLPPQLMNLTRAELFALHRQIAEALALLPEGSPERLGAAYLTCARIVTVRPRPRGARGAGRSTKLECRRVEPGREANARVKPIKLFRQNRVSFQEVLDAIAALLRPSSASCRPDRRKCSALLFFVPVASDAARLLRHRGLRQKAAMVAVENEGDKNASLYLD
jgi:hypothetical protein